jgi:hypothetical protein
MDAAGFDTLARSLQRHIARRTALGVLGGGLAALLTRVGPGDASARKKQKHKKKPKLNEFGCVNIGGKCRGKNGLCCSGICQGKKPKKKARRTRASASPTTAVAASLGRTPAMPLMSRVMVVLDFPVSASGRPARLAFAAARPTAGTAERTVTAKRQMGRGQLASSARVASSSPEASRPVLPPFKPECGVSALYRRRQTRPLAWP